MAQLYSDNPKWEEGTKVVTVEQGNLVANDSMVLSANGDVYLGGNVYVDRVDGPLQEVLLGLVDRIEKLEKFSEKLIGEADQIVQEDRAERRDAWRARVKAIAKEVGLDR